MLRRGCQPIHAVPHGSWILRLLTITCLAGSHSVRFCCLCVADDIGCSWSWGGQESNVALQSGIEASGKGGVTIKSGMPLCVGRGARVVGVALRMKTISITVSAGAPRSRELGLAVSPLCNA